MPYVNIPNDLSKVKTKIAFNLTKRQLLCFGGAALIGIPTYLLTRSFIGNSAAMFVMILLMLPLFFVAMYERDGLPCEKVVMNIIRARFIRPGPRPHKIENFYQWIVDNGKLTVMNPDKKLSTINYQLSTNKKEGQTIDSSKKTENATPKR